MNNTGEWLVKWSHVTPPANYKAFDANTFLLFVTFATSEEAVTASSNIYRLVV